MIEIIIIADDLTGAADTGIQFLDLAGRSLKMVGLDHKISGSPCGGLALHTETRNERPMAAKLAMDRVADVTRSLAPKIVYKKIDSCLRGHVGLELGALVRNLHFKGALVAPAYPTFGRVTKDGLHYVGDQLVSESEVAKDPIRPVTDSRLEVIIGQGHDYKVCRLGLEVIHKGVEAVTAAIDEMLNSSKGPVMIAADAVSDHDLDILAEASLKFKDRLILTGSAGLAGGLARVASERPAEVEEKEPARPIIYFGGSTSEKLQEQLGLLVDNGLIDLVTVSIADLLEHAGDLPLPPKPAEGRDLALVLPPPAEGAPTGEDYSRRLITAFGCYAAEIVRKFKPKTIFMSGGDTAQAILSCLNHKELWLRSEPLPGMVYVEAGNMALLTKAGSFGSSDILVKLHKNLKDPKEKK